MISNLYFSSDPLFFCSFPIEIQIFTLAQHMIFLLFSFINISKSKSSLCPNPMIFLPLFICIIMWFKTITSAQTYHFHAYFLLKSKSLLQPNPWFFFLFSYTTSYDFKSLLQLTPIFFSSYFLVKSKSLLRLKPMVFLLFSLSSSLFLLIS